MSATLSTSVNNLSTTAMVLVAGLGTRMRPLTLHKPKPLFEVGGRSMLDQALDRLIEIGIQRAVVNTHYLAEQITAHLATRRDIEIILSHEAEILDTGGGIKNMLSCFEDKPFFALNGDLPWIDHGERSLARMRDFWDATRMDALLLVMPTAKVRGFSPQGNFFMDGKGHLTRHDTQPPRPYVMLSAQIMKPQDFSATPQQIFSNNLIWDRAEAKQRLFGLEHRGTCYHVGTPEDWEQANQRLASGQGWAVD